LKWKDITPVNLSFADSYAALQSGNIDALSTLGQVAQLSISAGATQVGDYSKSLTSGNTLTIAAPAAIADAGKRAAIADLNVRLAKAVVWEYRHPIAWVKAQSDAQKTDFDQSYASWKAQWRGGGNTFRPQTAADIAAEQDVADRFYEAGSTPTRVVVKPLWSTIFKKSFTQAAALAQKAPK
jgi:sulfonate transport system substrate-binding protein